MKRILACAVLVGALCASFITPASAAVPASMSLKWRTSAAGAVGYVDSSTASINHVGLTSASVDTTAWFSTSDFDWQAMTTGHGATAQGAFRVSFTCPVTVAAYDTMFVAVESSADGVTPCSNTTFIGMVGVGGEEYISGVVTSSSTTQTTVGAGSIWLQPYLRLRVRCDGATTSSFLAAKVKIHYLKRGQ